MHLVTEEHPNNPHLKKATSTARAKSSLGAKAQALKNKIADKVSDKFPSVIRARAKERASKKNSDYALDVIRKHRHYQKHGADMRDKNVASDVRDNHARYLHVKDHYSK